MINLNTLHINSDIKLLFMANSITNKGRSNKSYTIKIARDSYNDEQLDQIFSSKAKRGVTFDAVYSLDGITMQGILKIRSIGKAEAEGVFLTGNGKLWAALENKNLRDYDWSAFDHTLTKANVIASEAKGDYIYDLCDRGAFLQEIVYTEKASRFDPGTEAVSSLAKVDITERYPAISIQTIIETILHEEGYGVTWTENIFNSDLDTLYLLFMEDNAIRNDKEWEKSAIFEATSALVNHTDTGIGNGGFSIERKLHFPTETFDNGDNFTGANDDNLSSNIYTVPETGTYRFIAPMSLQLVKPSLGVLDSIVVQVWIEHNGTSIYARTWTAGEISFDGNIAYITHELDTKPTEFEKDDNLAIWAIFYGNIEITGAWTMYLNQLSGSMFYNTVSRYYGANSTVSLRLPDTKALTFINDLCNYLNLYTFYREETKILEVEHGRRDTSIATSIEARDESEGVSQLANYELKHNTDKAAPLDDYYFDNSGYYEEAISFKFSRTLINDCFRAFGEQDTQIPILWKDGDPLSWSEVITPPKWMTKGNMRILKYTGNGTTSYTLTFGGNSSDNEDTVTSYPIFEEMDIEAFHRYDLEIEYSSIEIVARVDLSKLYNQTYFKNQLWIEGFGKYWLQEAEQMRGNVYKLKLLK